MTCLDSRTTECSLSLPLPGKVEILVKAGAEVKKGEILAEEKGEEFIEFNLQHQRNLTVSFGAKVEKDQVVGHEKSFLGKEKVFRSPASGEICGISKQGILKIKTEKGEKEILAPLAGKIKEATPSSLVLEFKGLKIAGAWGKGPKVWGVLALGQEREKEASLGDLGTAESGKILVFGQQISLGVMHKAEALGIKGIVCGAISQEPEESEVALLVVGDKDCLPEEVWLKLKAEEGNEVIISGDEKYLVIPLK